MAPSFWILTALVFVFTYVNGFHDGCNVVATLIASRSMKPYPALAWAAVVEVLSPFAMLVVGSSVSDTIKKLVGEAFYTDPSARSTALAFITMNTTGKPSITMMRVPGRSGRRLKPCSAPTSAVRYLSHSVDGSEMITSI